jgi:hypothetical protein
LALGEVLRMQREYLAAECVLRGLTQQLPEDLVPWQFLGRVYVDTGERAKFDQTIECLAAREKSAPDGRGSLFSDMLRVSWELVRGSVRVAEQLLSSVIAEAPEMPLPRQLLAQCLERRGAPAAELLKAYSDVLRVQPGNPHATAVIRRLQAANQRPPANEVTVGGESVFYVGSGQLTAAAN